MWRHHILSCICVLNSLDLPPSPSVQTPKQNIRPDGRSGNVYQVSGVGKQLRATCSAVKTWQISAATQEELSGTTSDILRCFPGRVWTFHEDFVDASGLFSLFARGKSRIFIIYHQAQFKNFQCLSLAGSEFSGASRELARVSRGRGVRTCSKDFYEACIS